MGVCCSENPKNQIKRKSQESTERQERKTKDKGGVGLKDSKKSEKTDKDKEKEKKLENKTEKKLDNTYKEDDETLNTLNEEQTKIYLETLFKSYYSAKTYFYDNELKDKELEAINIIKEINSKIEMVKQGNYKKINIENLPKKITPKFITGYTPEERKNEINKIINKLNKEKEQAQNIFNNKVAEMKKKFNKLNQSEKDKLKLTLDRDKNQISFISKEILDIKKTLESDYIPVPLCITTNEPYKKEKINDDIEENTMKIKVNGITYSKSNPLVILAIKGDNINIHKEIKGKSQDDMFTEFTWNFTDEQFKNLVKNRIEIVLGRSYAVKSTKVKGKGEIQLRKLKSTSSLDESVRLKMESGKSDTTIDIIIKLRNPLVEKEYEDDFREVIKIVKIYKEYKFTE